MGILVTAIVVGQLISMTPDYSEARKATHRVFSFLKKVPKIDSYSEGGIRPVSSIAFEFLVSSVALSRILDLQVVRVNL